MKKLLIIAMALLSLNFANAQTAEELKAERQQIKAELTNKKNIKKAKKIEKKVEQIVPLVGSSRLVSKPNETGINSVDGLTNTVSSLLAVSVSSSDLLSNYKQEICDNGDGDIEITKYKAKAQDYLALIPILTQASLDVAQAAQQLKSVKDDLKSLSPAQAASATKVVNWNIDAIDITQAKLNETTKLVTNLVNTLKATKNL